MHALKKTAASVTIILCMMVSTILSANSTLANNWIFLINQNGIKVWYSNESCNSAGSVLLKFENTTSDPVNLKCTKLNLTTEGQIFEKTINIGVHLEPNETYSSTCCNTGTVQILSAPSTITINSITFTVTP